MFDVDVIVIGAGVVGLAVARAFALVGRETIVVEAERGIGTGISSRNSEVIHAGLYYPTGSLKARLCVEGRDRLYAFCEAHRVPHARCGKLLVAVDPAELPKVEAIARQAATNGVRDLQWLTGPQVRELEPKLRAVAGFLSPSSGIIDSHAFMLALLGDLEDAGGSLALDTPIEGWVGEGEGLVLHTGGASPTSLRARLVVNCAGHGAVPLLRKLECYPRARLPEQRFCKGSYFGLRVTPPFQRLIYPVPAEAGLGVHATLDLAGRVRFGPDTEWVDDDRDFDVDPARANAFYAAIRRYWPDLPDGALFPDYAGIRPKLHGPGEQMSDFVVKGPREHGVPGLVACLGIESPGLTASLALAEHVLLLAQGGRPR